jgi:hypothetical protein
MPQRVTDFRIDQVEIAEADYWRLYVRELVQAYACHMRAEGGVISFELAIYRWEEINAKLRRLESGICAAPA